MTENFEQGKIYQYDNIVQTIMTNVLIEHARLGGFVLKDFKPTNGAQKLYFNVTAVVADLSKEPIYLDMPLLSYLKLRLKFGKKRRNLLHFTSRYKNEIDIVEAISVQEMMDFVCKELSLDEKIFEEINNEYYGWIK